MDDSLSPPVANARPTWAVAIGWVSIAVAVLEMGRTLIPRLEIWNISFRVTDVRLGTGDWLVTWWYVQAALLVILAGAGIATILRKSLYWLLPLYGLGQSVLSSYLAVKLWTLAFHPGEPSAIDSLQGYFGLAILGRFVMEMIYPVVLLVWFGPRAAKPIWRVIRPIWKRIQAQAAAPADSQY